jgi:adenylate kinase
MKVLLVAPPGAGKGTQAARLSRRYGIEHVSSGDILRAEVARGTDAGREAQTYLVRGDLVPDSLVLDMVMRRVVAAAAERGYVLDGFPRSLEQAEAAYQRARGGEAELQAAILLEVDDDELKRRMLQRSQKEDRPDDTPAVIEHRLEVYQAQTRPIIDLYRSRGLLRPVDGNGPVDEVTEAVVAAIADLVPPGDRGPGGTRSN